MKLTQPFFKLQVRFDAEILRAEVNALPAGAWARHPNAIEGNSALRLISVNGGENDGVFGLMQPTAHLKQCRYLRQILASFGVVWHRSRLMRLDPRSTVPEHADVNYQWFYRVRLHIPVVTHPDVIFHCGGQSVHMAAGEAWLFDNWRLHRVDNPSNETRIHLVADTTGTAAFWQFVAQSGSGRPADGTLAYRPDVDAAPLTERILPRPVMPPAELELLVTDLRGELVPRDESADARAQLASYHWLLQSFCFDWRQLYALHGEDPRGRREYGEIAQKLRTASRGLADGLMMRTNSVAAHTVLEARVLKALLHEDPASRTGFTRVSQSPNA